MSSAGPRILVDLDGVVVDLMGEAVKRGLFDHAPCKWNFTGCCTTRSDDDVFGGDIFATAKPILGAIHAVDALLALGLDVQFLSAPWPTNHQGCAHKYEWVERYFGVAGVKRLTLTHNKALVPGLVLVDDKPNLVGPWQHVTYPQAWNDSDYPTWNEGLASVVLAIAGGVPA